MTPASKRFKGKNDNDVTTSNMAINLPFHTVMDMLRTMQKQNDQFRRGFLALLCGAVAIGAAPIFMRLVDVSPSASAFWRVIISLPFLFAMTVRDWRQQPEDMPLMAPQSLRMMAIVGLLFATELTIWHQSVARTTVANATLLANMATVFTAIYGFLFFKERFSRPFLLSLLIALAGAALLIGQNADLNPNFIRGDILGIATAITYAGYIVMAARARSTLPVSAIMLTSAIFTAVAAGMLAQFEQAPFLPSSFAGWLPLIGLAVISHVIGQSLIIYGLAHVPAAFGAGTLLVQPVVAALIAWALFGEALGPLHVAGAALIFTGILMAKRTLRPSSG